MPQINRDGVTIHYEVSGSGPLVLLSHGYGATAAMWSAQLEALSAHHRILAWDMRGHGDSDSPDDPNLYSEAHTVADMLALIDREGASEAVIGGLSLGGYMSLAFQQAHPDRTRALMLFDTGPGYRSDEARTGWNRFAERQAEKFEARGLDALPRGEETARAQHRSATGLALAARGMLAQFDAHVIDGLAAIEVPALVLVGGRDEGYFAATDYMARKIPGARKVVIEDAGHAANLDQPARFNAAVAAFLAAL
ncbi:MAG TPA: alpha/beta fold hydrolase [Pseudomonadales bacterium]|nr:alpha/beta fold hydrolase [Pseudomonadales bacterium]